MPAWSIVINEVREVGAGGGWVFGIDLRESSVVLGGAPGIEGSAPSPPCSNPAAALTGVAGESPTIIETVHLGDDVVGERRETVVI